MGGNDDPRDSQPSIVDRVASNSYLNTALAAVPYAGGPMQVLLASYAQRRRETRWESFLSQLTARIGTIESSLLDRDRMSTDDFVDRVIQVESEAAITSDAKRLDYLKRYLISALWKNGPDTSWKDLFLSYLKRLTGSHLHILELFYSTQAQLSETDRFDLPQPTDLAPLTSEQLLKGTDQLYEKDLILVLTADLSSLGLIREWSEQGRRSPTGWSISTNGLAFMKYLTLSSK